MRVFAVERIRRLTVLERGFTPVEDLTTEAFGHSLGVNRGGKPERIVIEFSRRVAPYVGERTWHPSQQLEPLPDGGARLTLKVCRDWALRTWVLGWGAHARVVAPAALADEILRAARGGARRLRAELVFDSPLMFDRRRRRGCRCGADAHRERSLADLRRCHRSG